MQKILRLSAKALIVRDGKLLVTRKRDEKGDYYLIPGGGQEHGETLDRVVEREVLEETGYRAKCGDVAFIREYLGANHEFAATQSHFHQVEIYFRAELIDPAATAEVPAVPDSGQVAVDWLPIESVPTARIYPLALRAEIAARISARIYRGAVN